MSLWILVLAATTGVCTGLPFLYARKLAQKNADAGAKPLWFGGIANFYLVTSVLRKHSQQGDNWARRAYFSYCVGIMIPLFLIAVACINQLLSH